MNKEDEGPGEATFELTAEEEAALVESLQQIERGEFITGEELLRRIDKRA